MRIRRALHALPLAFLLPYAAAASDQQDTPRPPKEDLYQEALRSISEGRRSDASRELRRLVDKEPEHAGAWLELALTQCSLGNADEAERLFAIIETRFAPPLPMLEVIAQAREQGCDTWHAPSSWSVSAGRGIDHNVNQGARRATYVIDEPAGPVEHELSDDFKPMRDQYVAVNAEYTREVSRNGSTGFVQLAARRHDHLGQFDNGSVYAGLETPWRAGGWALRSTAAVAVTTLGGKLYQRQAQLQGRATLPLALPYGMQAHLLAAASHNDFLTLENFDSNVYELRSQLTWRGAAAYASASVGGIKDRALARRPGGDRRGWFGSVMARRRLAERLTGELAYTRQAWDSSLPYAPGIVDKVRSQWTGVVRTSLVYALSRNQSLQLEARVVRNHENISFFQYNNRQLQLSWQWQGP